MPGESIYVSFLWHWHGLWRRREGTEGLRQSLARLQGVAMPVSDLEASILPARLSDFSPLHLDELLGSGEHLWQGLQSVSQQDGLIAVYRREDFPALGRISAFIDGDRAHRIRDLLLSEDALDLDQIIDRLGAFPDDVQRTLWELAWNGEVTCDSLGPLRARLSGSSRRFHGRSRPRYTTRRRVLPGAGARWRLVSGPQAGFAPASRRRLAEVEQLVVRQGMIRPGTPPAGAGGLESLAEDLELLASWGRVRRRESWAGAGGEVFLAPGADESWRQAAEHPANGILAACDPASPFGAGLSWPAMAGSFKPRRVAGTRVLIHRGRCVGYLTAGGRGLYTPESLVDSQPVLALLRSAADRPVFLEAVNGDAAYETPWHDDLVRAGFSPSRRGYLLRAGH